jgi:hypothetical protein
MYIPKLLSILMNPSASLRRTWLPGTEPSFRITYRAGTERCATSTRWQRADHVQHRGMMVQALGSLSVSASKDDGGRGRERRHVPTFGEEVVGVRSWPSLWRPFQIRIFIRYYKTITHAAHCTSSMHHPQLGIKN